jgi:hypothetical protein
MLHGLALAITAYLVLTAVGSMPARVLLRGDGGARIVAMTPILGLAITMAWLDVLGWLLPMRIVAWTIVPLALVSLSLSFLPARRRPRPSIFAARDLAALALPTALAFVVGAVPLFVAGRLTVSALTNDDATYYITAAEQLQRFAWRVRLEGNEHCLSEQIIHSWYWRTGLPNLVAVISTMARVSAPAALGVVTTLLYGLVPAGAIVFTQLVARKVRRVPVAIVGALVALTAAPVFLGYQQLLGHLSAAILFPVACASIASAVTRGSVRRLALAGLLVGAGIAVFADGGIVLVLGFLSALVGARAPLRTRVARTMAIAVVALVAFLPTVLRAAQALADTLRYRVPRAKPMFPQRGWLERSLLDDLTTLVGTDPWPPWPSPQPLTIATTIAWIGALAAIPLLLWGVRDLRLPRVAHVLAASIGGGLVVAEVASGTRYLVGKVMLMGAAFVVPLAAVSFVRAASQRRWPAIAGAVWTIGALAATASLMRPEDFHVIDGPEHERMVTELGALPAGSIVALDGFGALADEAHDEHRAYRAALLASLRPIQPGLDGGFYRTYCRDPEPFLAPPPRAWALQRITAETISRGRALSTFGSFVLREIDLTTIDGVAGVYAPMVGWLGAERAPDASVFRWGSAEADARLRLVQRLPCARLEGEVRTVEGRGALSIRASDADISSLALGPTWSTFRTAPFDAAREQAITFRAELTTPPPDATHVFALRRLAISSDSTCVMSTKRIGRLDHDPAVPEPLDTVLEYLVSPAAGATCAQVVVSVAGANGSRLALDVGPGAEATGSFADAIVGVTKLTSARFAVHAPIAVRIRREVVDSTMAAAATVESIALIPCAAP